MSSCSAREVVLETLVVDNYDGFRVGVYTL